MRVISLYILACIVTQCVISEELPNEDSSSGYIFDGIVTTVRHCLKQKVILDCLKRKIIKKFDEEISNQTIEVNDIMTIKRDVDMNKKNTTDNQRSHELNVDEVKGSDLNGMIIDRINDYLKSIVVQFSLGGSSEGRKRKGGKGGMMMMYGALGMGSLISQLFMGKLAMISGTALLMAKLSLILAMMSGFKKMTGGAGGGEHVVYSGGDHGGGWQRSALAQDMVYRGYNVKNRKAEETPSYSNYGYYQEGRNDFDFS